MRGYVSDRSLQSVVVRRFLDVAKHFRIPHKRVVMSVLASTGLILFMLAYALLSTVESQHIRVTMEERKAVQTKIAVTNFSVCNYSKTVSPDADSGPLLSLTARPARCTNCFRWNISMLIDEPTLCEVFAPNESVDIIFLISSDIRHASHRDRIRSSWASVTRNNTSRMRHVFLLGASQNATLMDIIQEESDAFHDLIVGDFLDSYWNLTFKTLMSFRWAVGTCENARFFVKGDDDVWFSTDQLSKTLKEHADALKTGIGGLCHEAPSVDRNPNSKWCTPKEYYPDNVFPPYCVGLAYLGRLNIIAEVIAISTHIPFFFIDDVYVGMCLNQSGLRVHNLQGFVAEDTSCDHRDISDVAVHNTSRWRSVAKCSRFYQPSFHLTVILVAPCLAFIWRLIYVLWKLGKANLDFFPPNIYEIEGI